MPFTIVCNDMFHCFVADSVQTSKRNGSMWWERDATSTWLKCCQMHWNTIAALPTWRDWFFFRFEIMNGYFIDFQICNVDYECILWNFVKLERFLMILNFICDFFRRNMKSQTKYRECQWFSGTINSNMFVLIDIGFCKKKSISSGFESLDHWIKAQLFPYFQKNFIFIYK